MSYTQTIIDVLNDEIKLITEELKGYITVETQEYLIAYRDGMEWALEIVSNGGH